MPISTLNPMSGEVIESYEAYDDAHVDRIVEAASRAQRHWKGLDVEARAAAVQPMGELLRSRLEEYALLMTVEMGKPISQARAEIEKCAMCVDHYVEHAPAYLASVSVPTDARQSGFRYIPLGVILGVMPWNYPFWQVLRFAIPTLIAGNGVVLKHASNVPSSALALERLAAEAGLPQGLFAIVLLEGGAVTPLIHDPRIAGVSLTGSEAVGRSIAREAGTALKPAVLELGGSDPFIVLDDADIEFAGKAAATARTLNNGQTCIAAKRFIVDGGVHDEFVDATVEALENLTVGDPSEDSTELGPMARIDLRDDLHTQVELTIRAGAQLVLGGTVPDGPGAFYPASLMVGAGPGMIGFDEELFGPAGVVVAADDDEMIIELANASRYGLSSSVWSRDDERALALGARVETGMVFVNGIVRSDPRLPFGGVKASGYGRELGQHGMLEFVNTQTYWTSP